MDKFVSKITQARCAAQLIYSRLESLEMISSMVKHEKIESVEATRDECSIAIKGLGPMRVKIVDREPFKTIKYASANGKPLDFTLWLQLVEVDTNDTRLRLTLHAQIPALLRFMVKKKIQAGLDQAAEQIASAFSL